MSDEIDPPMPRRNFVVTVAYAFVGAGAAAVAWPFLAQLAPNPSTTPPPETAAVDLSAIGPGQTTRVVWNNMPVLVRHRPAPEIEHAGRAKWTTSPDQQARNPNLAAGLKQPALASDENRVVTGQPAWIVLIGACTHESCILHEYELSQRLSSGTGWLCPCCATRYDLSGRVVSGPAHENLAIPRTTLKGTRLTIG